MSESNPNTRTEIVTAKEFRERETVYKIGGVYKGRWLCTRIDYKADQTIYTFQDTGNDTLALDGDVEGMIDSTAKVIG